jgi:D-alanine--poly(phosphoribitol) ligase subunit 1
MIRTEFAARDRMADPLALFVCMAERVPDQIAVEMPEENWSYSALAELAWRFADLVRHFPTPRVVIDLPRGAQAYAAMLGTGLGGGVYTPLHSDTPDQKAARILTRLNPDLIVTTAERLAFMQQAAPKSQVVTVQDIPQTPPTRSRAEPHRLAYILFTSGSTGEPKGVEVPRPALETYCAWVLETLAPKPGDRIAQFTSLGFDISVTEVYGALCSGATLIPPVTRLDEMDPVGFVEDKAITIINTVPSMISFMMRSGSLHPAALSSVRMINLCGEPLYQPQIEALFSAAPDAIVQNTYGPTEATVAVSCQTLTRNTYRNYINRSASIGRALPGCNLVLDPDGTAEQGELVIAGAQLAQGYLDDPEKTSAAFRPLPDGRIGYWTGDIFERVGENLYFRCRKDHQIKIRGHRLEIEGIEAAFHRCGWPTVVVAPKSNETGTEALGVLIENTTGKTLDSSSLRTDLAQHLEPFAIPAFIKETPAIPRNQSGKLDRSASAALIFGD